jgi:hypothetical protein
MRDRASSSNSPCITFLKSRTKPSRASHGRDALRMMTPLHTNEDIFEFQRAEVLCISPGGEVLSRLVAVHRRTGQVGTETLAQFHTRYLRITNRCEKYMMGQLDLYPLDPSRLRPEARPMPDGPPDLGFFGRKS